MNKESIGVSIEVQTVQEKEKASLMFYGVDILDDGIVETESITSIMLLGSAITVMTILLILVKNWKL